MEQLRRTQHYEVFSHRTRKCLLCVKGLGGRVTDQHRMKHSGFLDKLLPEDFVPADRGFTVKDGDGLLVTPPFTRGKKHLSRTEIESAREISRVRSQVERVI